MESMGGGTRPGLREPTSSTRLTERLPNLLVVGAPKCGTTSLHNYLNAHPEVDMSELKELNFFIDGGTWTNGPEWYASNFDPTAPVRGESSTSYTRGDNSPAVARRAQELLGDVRIIYLVRDPLERFRSDHQHHRSTGREPLTLDEAVEQPSSPYLQASSYGTQLEPYVELFGTDRILVITQESLSANRPEVLARAFSFLEVDDCFSDPIFERRFEQSTGKGWGYRLAWKVRQRGVRLPKVLRWPAQRALRSRLLGERRRPLRSPTSARRRGRRSSAGSGRRSRGFET